MYDMKTEISFENRKLFKSVTKFNPQFGLEVTFSGEDIDSLKWDSTPIPKDTILAKQAELKADYDAKKYQRDRANEYPSWQDQMDMLWHSIDENAELKQKYFAFYEAIKAVKAKYPK